MATIPSSYNPSTNVITPPKQTNSSQQLTPQEKAIQKEKEILEKKGLPQPTLEQKQQFYSGTPSPLAERLAEAKVIPGQIQDPQLAGEVKAIYGAQTQYKELQRKAQAVNIGKLTVEQAFTPQEIRSLRASGALIQKESPMQVPVSLDEETGRTIFEYRKPIQSMVEFGKSEDIRRAEQQKQLKEKFPWYKPIKTQQVDIFKDIEKGISFLKEHKPTIERKETAFTKQLEFIQEKQKSQKLDLTSMEKKVGEVVFGRDYEPFATISRTIEKLTPAISEETKLREEARTTYKRLNVLSELRPEEQAVVKERLEKSGVRFIPTSTKEGQTIYKVKLPEKYSEEKIGDISKIEREPIISFALRKIGIAYEETYKDISQRILFKGPTIFEPQKKITQYSPEAEIIGKTFGKIGEYQFYFLPGTVGGAIGTTAFVGPTIESALRGPKGFLQYAKEEPFEVAIAGAYGGYKAMRLIDTYLNPVDIASFYPDLKLKKAVEPYSRPRATALLKTPEGGYVLGKTKSGEIISFGGLPNKGESYLKAAKRELFEETGLKGIKLKSIGKTIFPEETFYTYIGEISKSSISKLKPSSDIAKIVYLPPWRVSMTKFVSGQTALQPISRLSLFPLGKIRSYEYSLIRKAEFGLESTWLGAKTKYGKFLLGSQSRYDVPWKYTKEYEEVTGFQKFAHGTTSPAILKKYTLGEKQFEILAFKSQRGVQGLYVHPPTYASLEKVSYAKYQKGILDLKGLRTEAKVKDIYGLTPSIKTGTGKYLPGAPGYIGLSYMGYGPKSYELGIKIGRETPTALLFKEKIGGAIIPTIKAKLGKESERIIRVGTEISTRGRAGASLLGGRVAYFQPVKITKAGKTVGVTMDIATYGKGYYYISPEAISKVGLSFYPSYKETEKQVSIKYSPKISKEKIRPAPYTSPTIMRESYAPISKYQEYKPPIIPYEPKTPPYTPLGKPTQRIFKIKEFPELGEEPFRIKPMKKKRKFKESIAISEGFISHILGRKPRIIKLKDIGKELPRYRSISALREAPIIR